ncbi:MAG: protein-glutamate O-methyltransferase CheR [Thermacetogeniaceae bacterium]|jgi:chemotaxis protein methyltransferase CheR
MSQDEYYDKIVELIYKETGISFDENKKYFVERRINDNIKNLRLSSSKDYYRLLKYTKEEYHIQKLINDITINETYFFRDFDQLDNFAETALPILIREKNKTRNIRVWSAGCSTGEEPYTLTIILLELLPDPSKWEIEITGTDINTRVLDEAERGVFNERSVKDVPDEYLIKYFKLSKDKYLVNDEVKRLVNFQYGNILNRDRLDYFDLIFCRNVLIYFDDDIKSRAINNFFDSLKPGGFIYLGHAETFNNLLNKFRTINVKNTNIFCKP